MKPSEVRIYTLLLIVVLVFSYRAWKAEEVPTGDSDVVVFDPGKAGASSVDWTGERSAAHLEFSGSSDDREVWITAGRRSRIAAPAPPPVEATEAGTEAEAGESTTPAQPEPVYGDPELTSFPGNSSARDLADRFSPLTALRRFDNLTEEQITNMGLDATAGQLVVEGGGRSLTLEIGDKAYGSSDLYVRQPGGTTAYLLSRKVVGPLKSASTSLRDKNLFGFEAAEAKSAVLTVPGRKAPVAATHQGRHDKDNSFWSQPDSAEVDADLDALVKRVFEAKASKYLKQDQAPAEGSLKPVLSVAFGGDSKPLGSIEFARASDAAKSTEDSPVWLWYARSERSRGQWVEVSGALGRELVEAVEALD